MTIFALDFGEKNIGVAVGESVSGATKPLEVIRRTKDQAELDQIRELANSWKAQVLVIGIALNSEGEDTPSSRAARKFGRELREKLKGGLSLVYHPEQMSTQESNKGLSRTQKQKMGDAYAAEHILKGYISTL